MKKITLIALFALSTTFLFAQSTKGNATATRIDGYYCFVECTPQSDYTVLGTVKGKGLTMGSGSYLDIRDNLIKKVKDEFPKADGIIFHFKEGERDAAEAIMFK